ncbi:hypothetical protein NE865_08410 [Phthorimaea operculella]|nr:hypothetical protein NE865_08410 [Phthorimaea operculella]
MFRRFILDIVNLPGDNDRPQIVDTSRPTSRPTNNENQAQNDNAINQIQVQVDIHEDVRARFQPTPPPIIDCTSAAPRVASTDPAPAVSNVVTPVVSDDPPSIVPTGPTVASNDTQPAVEAPILDPELLAALGDAASDTPEFGPSVHDSLANIWQPLLKKGLTKEVKDKLLKEYLIPSNCKLLQAPKLNAEIAAAVSEGVRGRDKKYVAVQQQLGQGIAAVNRAMDVLLKSDNKVEALKYLSDSGRILSDLHSFFTKDRVKLVTPSLEKNFLHVVQDTQRDEFLFGNTLSEKIKASKAIEKQGQQIKKNITSTKANTTTSSSARPSTFQGNWSGPPRYSTNRGGRGGNRRTNPPPATRRPYTNTTTQTRPPGPHKPRAPAHRQ